MRLAHLSSLGVAAGAVVLGACASMPAKEGAQAERVCINKSEITSIVSLDDRHAFVKVRASHFYLFTMDKTCQGLKLARTVAIESTTTRVCGDGVSLLSFEYPAVGPMRCRIEGIESVADKDTALQLIESRTAPE